MYTLMPGKEIRRLATYLILLMSAATLPVSAIPGLESHTGLGGEFGWSRLRQTDNLTVTDGRRGQQSFTLAEQSYEAGLETDLLPVVDSGGNVVDRAGRYRIRSMDADITTDQALRGDAALRFRAGGNGITLASGPGALFHTGRVWDAFSIEFLMQPVRPNDGSEILAWNGTLVIDGEVLTQSVRVFFERRRLIWEFENLFILPDLEPFTVRVEGAHAVTPGRVAHHQLRFDPQTGALTYLVDGSPDAITYATEDRSPGSTVRIPAAGSGSGNVYLGRGFSGILDSLRIEERYVTDPALTRYDTGSGFLITEPLDLGREGSQLVGIAVERRLPHGTDIVVSYRVSDALASLNGSSWRTLERSEQASLRDEGRFVQLRAEFFADGRGDESPVLDAIRIRYLPSRPPAPPPALRAEAGDGSVTLRWDHAPGDSVVGYDIFYGNRPGQYFGDDADQGHSPISVDYLTEFELTGLSNGRMYFFTIVARDRTDSRDGMFSREVEVRPNP